METGQKEETKYALNVDVVPSGIQSACVIAPFDKAKEELEKAGYRIISGEENVSLRILHGAEHPVSKNGNWIKEGGLYLNKRFGKKAGLWIPQTSLVMMHPAEATNAHKQRQEFYVSDEQAEEALKGAVKVERTSVPIEELANEESTSRVFGKESKNYGLFLKENTKIKAINFHLDEQKYVNKQSKPYAIQLWLRGLGGGSGLDARGWDYYGGLDDDDALRGVLNKTGEASRAEISYSPDKIKEALQKSGLSGVEAILFQNLMPCVKIKSISYESEHKLSFQDAPLEHLSLHQNQTLL